MATIRRVLVEPCSKTNFIHVIYKRATVKMIEI
jgi:hypothetical protein